MKFTKSLLALVLTGVLLTGCKESVSESGETSSANKSVAAKSETASFSIEGMSCSIGCAKTIEKKLAGMDGVEKVSIDFDSKMGKVKFDAEKLTAEELVEAVESAADGKTYKVADVKSSADQAMVYPTDPVKKDKKKKKKKGDKDANTDSEIKADGKPACCASKKACTT